MDDPVRRNVREARRRLTPLAAASVAALVPIAAAAGCGDSPASPEQELAGDYSAVEWTITSSTTNDDLLAAGGHLDITLRADGTTSGEFFIPAGASPEPQEQRVSMAGTWTLSGDIVRFEMPGDTYVRFVDWEVSGRELRTEFVNGGFTVVTRLRR